MQVLLEDQSENAGPDYVVSLRGLDGSSPIRLGEGHGGNFSPDGKWTATAILSSPESVFLLPIGPGERKELLHPGVRSYGYSVQFMPDGQSVLFAGIEPGHLARCYIQSVRSGLAKPLTPEGVLGGFPSPNGRYLIALQLDQSHAIFDILSGELRAIPGDITKRLFPIRWSSDSRHVYLFTRTSPPSQIWQLDITSGEEKPIRQLSPADPVGILEILQVQMTPDARKFVYAYDRYLSELYVVDGLH